jgi:hypothetical protein
MSAAVSFVPALPALPPSFGQTVGAVQGIALVVTNIVPMLRSAKSAQQALSHLQTTCIRALGMSNRLIQSMTATQDQLHVFSRLKAPDDADILQKADLLAGARATLHDLQDSLNDSLAGLQDIASALQACRRYDQVFAMNREWRAAAEKLDTLVKTYERDLRATRIVEILAEFLVRLDQAFDLVMELLARPDVPLPDPLHDARALAIEGFDAWLKSLPSEEWSPVDPAQVVDVHWVDSVGWVEGRKTA